MSGSVTEYDVLEAMVQYGGSFIRGLGQLCRQADISNKARLVAAFPEYFAEYRQIAARHQRIAAERSAAPPEAQ